MQNNTTVDPAPTHVGRLSVHPRGFGFVELDDGLSAFVPPPVLKPFLAGDVVAVRDLVDEGSGKYRAEGLELQERWREHLFGRLERRRGRDALRVDPRVGSSDWKLTGVPKKLEPETAIVARLDGKALVFERAVPEAEASLTAVLVNWGITPEFPAECLTAAKRTTKLKLGKRRDLREVPTVTIDAPYSHDLDDALAVLPPQADGAVRVLVSIADVDTAVPAGSALDAEARRRGTSVYLPGQTIPMLPPTLSEQSLSLLPDVERAALTVELRIDPDGAITSCDVERSLIRSHARLSYEGVRAFLDEGDEAGVPRGVQETLRWLRTAASRIAAARATRGGVSLERDEVRLVLDDEGEPTDVESRATNSAHKIVEHLMVAANEGVAAWLAARGLPALYRTQAAPTLDRVEALARSAEAFGFQAAFGRRLTPRALMAFEEQFRTSTIASQVRTVLRRVLGRAGYTVEPAPHFALGAPLYLHFTSPIRRYADLIVHRVVKAHLAGAREQDARDPALAEIAAEVNELAYRSSKAEQERQRCLVARLFADRLGEERPGRITAVKPFGLVVQLDGLGISGTLPVSELEHGPWQYERETESLRSGRRRHASGDAITVAVSGADEALGRLELSPVKAKGKQPRSSSRASATSKPTSKPRPASKPRPSSKPKPSARSKPTTKAKPSTKARTKPNKASAPSGAPNFGSR